MQSKESRQPTTGGRHDMSQKKSARTHWGLRARPPGVTPKTGDTKSHQRLRQYTNLRTLLLDPSASQSRRRRPTTRSSRRRRYSLVSPVRGLSREAELKTTLPPQRVMESILFAAAGGPVPLPHISTGLGTRGPGWLSTRDARRL